MNQCPRCAQEVPQSATECAACTRQGEEDQPSARGKGRDVLMIVAAVVGSGVVTLALLVASGERPSDAAAAPVAPPRIERAASPPPSKEPTSPKWTTGQGDWLANPRTGSAFEVRADNRVPVWQRAAHPAIVVRCVSGRTEVFVYTESAAKLESQDDKHTVRIRFDEGAEVTERWPDAADHDALFAPNGPAFAEQLTRARTLRFGFTPHNAEPVVATFQVAGLRELMSPVARQCGR